MNTNMQIKSENIPTKDDTGDSKRRLLLNLINKLLHIILEHFQNDSMNLEQGFNLQSLESEPFRSAVLSGVQDSPSG